MFQIWKFQMFWREIELRPVDLTKALYFWSGSVLRATFKYNYNHKLINSVEWNVSKISSYNTRFIIIKKLLRLYYEKQNLTSQWGPKRINSNAFALMKYKRNFICSKLKYWRIAEWKEVTLSSYHVKTEETGLIFYYIFFKNLRILFSPQICARKWKL